MLPPTLPPPPVRSPHVRALNERIAVGGQPIPAAELDALVGSHADAIEAAQVGAWPQQATV